ncbi:site-2 protease family protein [Candidatus Saccharibacteria bacterium]|nr:MAG: site-2 protease family protein [Candidatus Saccharibacteria bacterium]
MAIVVFVLGIILFLLLIITHEMGHFLVAKRNGVKAEEFGIFFPPKLWGKKMKGGWDFTINALPLGGFVKLKGEHDSDTEKGSFGAASDWAKAKIMLAGVAVNLVTALVLFTILALFGMPKLVDNQFTVASDTKITRHDVLVGYVEEKTPAAKAGLQERDKLLSFASANKTVTMNGQKLSEVTKQFAGQTVTIRYERGGQSRSTQATLLSEAAVQSSSKTNNPKGYLGVAPQEIILRRSTWSAPVVAVGLSAQFTQLTLKGIGTALSGLGGIIAGGVTGNTEARQQAQTEASSQVSGPLGIYFVLKGGSSLGILFMLFIIAIISLTLAIMNVLPVPALDGGRLYLMLASRLTKAKRLTPKMEENIVGASFMLLIGLIILITIVDVKRFF